MTPEFREKFQDKRFETKTKGIWKSAIDNSAQHQLGVRLILRPENGDSNRILLHLYVNDEDEKFEEAINQAITNLIETHDPESYMSTPLTFNPSTGELEGFRRVVIKVP